MEEKTDIQSGKKTRRKQRRKKKQLEKGAAMDLEVKFKDNKDSEEETDNNGEKMELSQRTSRS